jgi:DNA (cytosine-5)-methyltransferase 1
VVQVPSSPKSPIPIVSLFSGPGGLDLGFQQGGFETISAFERSQVAVNTFNQNLLAVATVADLATAKPEDIVAQVRKTGRIPAGVIGGPPCQAFSTANVRQRNDDPRRRLIFRFEAVIGALDEAFNIDFFLMENVAHLAKRKHRELLDRLKAKFRRRGFEVYETVINAALFGVPQLRPRLFLVGIKRDLASFARFDFPKPETLTPATVREAIQHLGDPVFFDRSAPKQEVPGHPNHWTMMPRSAKFGTRGIHKGRSFRRLRWDEPSPVVAYGHREIHVHPSGKRRLSILEAMLLQGFPETYKLAGNLSEQVTQVSDAVPPPLARALAEAIRIALYDRRRAVQSALAVFFAERGRSFPWRNARSLFHILVAEKLLQQTAANDAVVHAYRTITKRWKAPADLAAAPAREVERLVQPLGLQYRADELQRMALAIVESHDGAVPTNPRALLALPGVGAYAANAVRSFSGAAQVAVVDTNVSRLLRRLFHLSGNAPANPARDRRLQRLAAWLIAGEDSRVMNYAILDLTADVCTARKRACERCPLRRVCASSDAAGAEAANHAHAAIDAA